MGNNSQNNTIQQGNMQRVYLGFLLRRNTQSIYPQSTK